MSCVYRKVDSARNKGNSAGWPPSHKSQLRDFGSLGEAQLATDACQICSIFG
jgi:hypothetical protein